MQQEPGVWVAGPDGNLIPDYESTFPEINEGEVVHGTVVRVDKDEVLVDIGYKSEGVIPVAELSIRRSINPADEVSVGDEIDALVLTKEDAEGRLILSKKRARFELAWKNIERAAESGEPVDGRVIEVVKGGLILDLGVRGFLPASLVDIRRVQDLDEFLGQELRCKVIELNRSRNNVVLSRRAVLEEERKEQRQQILDRLQPGAVVEGQISNIVDFGAFVDLDGMDGLIHISELSWSHVNHPSEILEIGQTVQVKVLDIDRDRQRISLGLKQTQNDPWQQVLESYHENDVVEGRVTKVVTFGAFVEILPGVEGPRAHLRARPAPRREPARGRLAGPGGQRQDHRDRRRAPAALALAEARRAGRSRPAARRRRRVRPPAPEPRPVRPAGTTTRRRRRPTPTWRRSRPSRRRKPTSREMQGRRARGRGRGSRPRRARAGRGRARSTADDIRRGVSRPVAVAITGGIGAGKSEALAAFARHGAATVSSDEIVHELLRRDEVREAIVERFGHGVVAPDGHLDRGAVATIVFNDRRSARLAREPAASARRVGVHAVARAARGPAPSRRGSA